MKVLPLFKSHYSIGKSILTLDKAGSSSKEGSSSIVDIAKENKLEQVFLVEENMSSFLDAFKNFGSIKTPFFYGLRLDLCPDINDKTEESLKKSSKIIIFAKNGNGYKKLIKIFSIAATNGFYYTPRIDEKTLTDEWDETSLKLCVPFYDSFLFNNTMSYSLCCPELKFTSPGERDLVDAVRYFAKISGLLIVATVFTGLVQVYLMDGAAIFTSSHGRLNVL